jgi:phosphoglycerate kinase
VLEPGKIGQNMTFCETLNAVLAKDSWLDELPLEQLLEAIPTLDSLPPHLNIESVLVRTDLDMAVDQGRVVELSRLYSSLPTVRYCQSRGWKPILFGHLGRDRKNSMLPVANAFSEALNEEVTFVADWIDEDNDSVLESAVDTIRNAPKGSVVILENTRKYAVEQQLWKESNCTATECERLDRLATSLASRFSSVEINEAIAASNLDFSSIVAPLRMEFTAMGFFISSELKQHITAARQAQVVVISGLKPNKLDDLEEMLKRGMIKKVFVAGSLAMSLIKARSLELGEAISIGRAETDSSYKGYVEPERIDQARRILRNAISSGIEISLPLDFVLEDGSIVSEVPPGRVQLDVGPVTRQDYAQKLIHWAGETTGESKTLFFNGVFGMFEDPMFSKGSEEIIQVLMQLTAMGVKTFVGGGEGRAALLMYGSEDQVTHAFTAGGTILKSLSNRHIGYLKAMYLQNSLKTSA